MAAWSGRGIPPTRKKLHRLRQQLIIEAAKARASERSEAARRDGSWRSRTKKSIINPERFEELWG